MFQTEPLELRVAFNLGNLGLALDPITLGFGGFELLLSLGDFRLRSELGRLGVAAGVGADLLSLRLGVRRAFLGLRHRLFDVLARRRGVRFDPVQRLLRGVCISV